MEIIWISTSYAINAIIAAGECTSLAVWEIDTFKGDTDTSISYQFKVSFAGYAGSRRCTCLTTIGTSRTISTCTY